jgi:DNA-binding LacI/PurR family transcriptional regulator
MVGKMTKQALRRRKSASPVEAVLSSLRDGIASGKFESGEQLPSVRALAASLKVSPNTVNAALGVLESERLINRVPQKGVFVRGVSFDPAQPVALVSFLIRRVPDENWNVHVGLGAAAELSARGIPFAIVEPDRPMKDFDDLKGFILSKVPHPGGVIFTWAACDQENLLAFSKEIGAPAVKVGRHSQHCSKNFVSIDHFEAGRLAALRCLKRLDRPFLLLSGSSMHDFPRRQLFDGFVDRLQEERPPSCKFEFLSLDGGEMRHGFEALREYLKGNEAPGCVFCVGDHIAIGAMRAAQEAGLKVPEDISFVGSSGLDSAKMSQPSLAYVHQPMELLGAEAAASLYKAKGAEGFEVPGEMVPVSWEPGGSLQE